jgi:RNA ligase (TIGR02306 family)
MRALATIETIQEVHPIPNADAIEKVRIRGWQCVAKKGEFQPGDPCVFHEIDSLLPIVPQYDFLAKGNPPKKMMLENGTEIEGYRLRTVVLRGAISQGLALPLKTFPNLAGVPKGSDVTSLLNICLYEPPIPEELRGVLRGAFPGFIPKTDELRVQNILGDLQSYQGQHFSSTVKIDGSSSTIYKTDDDFGVCWRRWDLIESDDHPYWKLSHQYNLRDRLPKGYAVQAEGAGEEISKNRHKLKGQDLYVFYVFDINKYRYLELNESIDFCKDIGLKMVPVFSEDFIMGHTHEELLALADGPCPLNPKVPREGLVFRLSGSNPKISFKIISNAYLVKYGL